MRRDRVAAAAPDAHGGKPVPSSAAAPAPALKPKPVVLAGLQLTGSQLYEASCSARRCTSVPAPFRTLRLLAARVRICFRSMRSCAGRSPSRVAWTPTTGGCRSWRRSHCRAAGVSVPAFSSARLPMGMQSPARSARTCRCSRGARVQGTTWPTAPACPGADASMPDSHRSRQHYEQPPWLRWPGWACFFRSPPPGPVAGLPPKKAVNLASAPRWRGRCGRPA